MKHLLHILSVIVVLGAFSQSFAKTTPDLPALLPAASSISVVPPAPNPSPSAWDDIQISEEKITEANASAAHAEQWWLKIAPDLNAFPHIKINLTPLPQLGFLISWAPVDGPQDSTFIAIPYDENHKVADAALTQIAQAAITAASAMINDRRLNQDATLRYMHQHLVELQACVLIHILRPPLPCGIYPELANQ